MLFGDVEAQEVLLMNKAHSFLFVVVVFLAVALPLSAQQGPINPKAVALLRWYPANVTTTFSVGGTL